MDIKIPVWFEWEIGGTVTGGFHCSCCHSKQRILEVSVSNPN